MFLRNRKNERIYFVVTESDEHGGFMIYATENDGNDSFCMHYLTLAEFIEEWEDI